MQLNPLAPLARTGQPVTSVAFATYVPERFGRLTGCYASLLLLALAVVPVNLAAAEYWYDRDGNATTSLNQGGVDGFGAILFMTNDSEATLRNWSDPASNGFHILDTDKIIRGQPIESVLVFSGCHSNNEGHCVAEVDYKILSPDGSIYAHYQGTELWKNKPAIPSGKLGLSVDRIGLIIEPGDQLGVYRVECVVRDLVAKKQFSITTTFTALDDDAEPDA